MPQQVVEQVLGERAAELGVRVRRGVGLDDLRRLPDGVRAELEDAGSLEADWVVG